MNQRKRGRPSSASLAIVPTEIPRPDAPYDLTDEETEEWWAVVNRMDADWFPRETHALLAAYCRHVISGRRLSELVHRLEKSRDFDLHEYDKLLKMRERESKAASSLATRMRITQQSSYDRTRRKPQITPASPWQS